MAEGLRQSGDEEQEIRRIGTTTQEHMEEKAGAPPLGAHNDVEERRRSSEV
jgi:hypothetical protein